MTMEAPASFAFLSLAQSRIIAPQFAANTKYKLLNTGNFQRLAREYNCNNNGKSQTPFAHATSHSCFGRKVTLLRELLGA